MISRRRRDRLSCLVLGDQGVGKTSFCNRLRNKKFCEKEEPTQGPFFYLSQLSENTEFELWDTGGSERYRPLAQIYLNARKLYIIVFDLTNKESFEHVKTEWWPMVRDTNSQSQALFLVGARLGEGSVTCSIEDIQRFANEHNGKFFQVNSKEKKGFDDVRKALQELATPKNDSAADLLPTNRNYTKGCIVLFLLNATVVSVLVGLSIASPLFFLTLLGPVLGFCYVHRSPGGFFQSKPTRKMIDHGEDNIELSVFNQQL